MRKNQRKSKKYKRRPRKNNTYFLIFYLVTAVMNHDRLEMKKKLFVNSHETETKLPETTRQVAVLNRSSQYEPSNKRIQLIFFIKHGMIHK